MNESQRSKILSALIKYDSKQAKKPSYNRYALAQYCGAVTRAKRHCDENGADLRLALLNCFCGRLLDVVLRAVDLPTSTRDEQLIGGYPKLPELKDEQ